MVGVGRYAAFDVLALASVGSRLRLQSPIWGRGPKVGLQTFNLLVWVRFPAPPLSVWLGAVLAHAVQLHPAADLDHPIAEGPGEDPGVRPLVDVQLASELGGEDDRRGS